MKSIIYSIYIDINNDNLEQNVPYMQDNIPKSLRTKIEFAEHSNTLVRNKTNYANNVCESEFKLFTYDKTYQEFHAYFSQFNTLEFDIINFYKLYLFEKLSQDYDRVLYLDLDVVINTDINYFEHFSEDKIHGFAPNCSQKNVWKGTWMRSYVKQEQSFDEIVRKNLEKHNIYVKNMAKKSMMATQFKNGNDYLINTAILSGTKNTINQLDFFQNIETHIDYFNTAKQDCFFGEELTKRFFVNNEVFFSFVIENYDIPFANIGPQWHYIFSTHAEGSYNTSRVNNAHLVHVIDKNFSKAFKMCKNMP